VRDSDHDQSGDANKKIARRYRSQRPPGKRFTRLVMSTRKERTAQRAVFIPLLGAFVREIHYDFCAKKLRIYMPELSCTDMRGAIKFAQLIDRDVQHIFTYSDSKRDTYYVRDGERWTAIMPFQGTGRHE
jgi:hypothetical protein